MLIQLTEAGSGRAIWVAPDAIVSVSDTSDSDRYMGRRALVVLSDGQAFHATQTAGAIAETANKDLRA